MNKKAYANSPTPTRVRLDKWLWAARFFKTRSLACEAINGGKVLLNGSHTKPGKEISPNALLRIRRGDQTFEVAVLQISLRRGPATEAVLLYKETPESTVAREVMADRFRLDALARPVSSGRPNKSDRRRLTELKHHY